MEPPYNEKDLLQKIAGGDEGAFRFLFDTYYDQLYSTALMYTKIHAQAEDIVQQVFLKIWEKRSTLGEINSIENYLFIIARNQVMSYFTSQSAHAGHHRRIRELFREEEGTPEDDLIIKQEKELLEQAITELPVQQQKAYRLSREGGLTYEEIAGKMGLSVNTVKGHISAALRSLREYITRNKDKFLYLLIFF